MNIKEVSELMNTYSRKVIPFLVWVDFELAKPRIYRLDELPEHVKFNFWGVKNYINGYSKVNIPIEYEALDLNEYAWKYQQVIDELNYGNSFLLNLSIRSKLKNRQALSSFFYNSKAKYRLLVDNEFVCFSPETFVKIKDGRISSFPMKGTIDATIPNAKSKILANKKERAEHFTIVDLIRNDLSRVAKKVTVDRLRYIDKIKTNNKDILQVSSEISGVLPENYRENLGDIFMKLLPAGSICGAPKKKTVELIGTIEGEERGYYTGVAGLFDGEHFDSTVMIRFIEKRDEQLYYRSGGGITAQSDMISEYQEIMDKIYVPVH